jgi:hypothetical protein
MPRDQLAKGRFISGLQACDERLFPAHAVAHGPSVLVGHVIAPGHIDGLGERAQGRRPQVLTISGEKQIVRPSCNSS